MPSYSFKCPKTSEVREIFQSMMDEHKYEVNGVEWERVWSSPQLSMDVKVDPFSAKQFLDKTSKPGQTLGSLWDRAADLKEERAEKTGEKFERQTGKQKKDITLEF